MVRRYTSDQEADLISRLRRDDITDLVEEKYAGRSIDQGVNHPRAQSYDHCYNYFADTPDLRGDIEKSCAVLGIYLASWGMYRGSSHLLKNTNSSDLEPVVQYIQQHRHELSAIDLDSYSDENIAVVLDTYAGVRAALPLDNHRAITLVTKVMAVAFGCIPAFDRNFSRGFARVLSKHAKLPVERLTFESLQLLRAFYLANKDAIDDLHARSRTVAFRDGTATDHRLTKAKIADMYCFELGRS